MHGDGEAGVRAQGEAFSLLHRPVPAVVADIVEGFGVPRVLQAQPGVEAVAGAALGEEPLGAGGLRPHDVVAPGDGVVIAEVHGALGHDVLRGRDGKRDIVIGRYDCPHVHGDAASGRKDLVPRYDPPILEHHLDPMGMRGGFHLSRVGIEKAYPFLEPYAGAALREKPGLARFPATHNIVTSAPIAMHLFGKCKESGNCEKEHG